MSTTSVRKPRTTSTSASTPMSPVTRGRVIFVGTGPGDPDLLTLGAIAALADASAVILDSDRQQAMLSHPAITLAYDAEVATLGLSEAGRPLSPSARAKLVLKHACAGARVVRLVHGDPFLDNAVADEAAACVRGGIDFEVVPGVSSLTAVPEYAGVDLSHGMRGALRVGHRGQVQQGRRCAMGQRRNGGRQHRGVHDRQPGRGREVRRPVGR